MRVKIVSDGTIAGTQIIDADTGVNISKGMRCTRIVIDAVSGSTVATLLCEGVAIDITAAARLVKMIGSQSSDIDAIDMAIDGLQQRRAKLAGR